MKKALFILVLLLSFTGISGNIKSGFKALDIYDYFKAKKNFETSSKSDYSPANFGLALICYRNDNPFHDIGKAYFYINQADSAYHEAKDRKKEKWLEYSVDGTEIQSLKQKVSAKIFERILTENTILAYQNFIDSNSWAIEIHAAEKLRDHLELENAKAEKQSLSIDAFLKRRPDSHLYNEALRLFFELQYSESTIEGGLNSFVKFINDHPKSPYLNEAQNNVFRIETKEHKLQDYTRFISKYPLNPNIDSAWRLLYDKYTANYSKQSIEAFQNAYPEYPFQDEINKELKLIAEVFIPIKRNGRWGYSDLKENITINPIFDYVGYFDEGLALVDQNGKYGFINKMGEFVIPAIYDEAEAFSDGLSIVSINEALGCIDRSGKEVIQFGAEDIGICKGNLFYAQIKGKDTYHFYSNQGIEKNIGPYTYVKEFNGETAIVRNDTAYGVVQVHNGAVKIKNVFDQIQRYGSDFKCKTGGKWLIINLKGDTLTKKEYKFIGDFSEGMAYVENEGKYGFIDTTFNEIIPLNLTTYPNSLILAKFKNGSSRMMSRGKMGLIDKKNVRLVPAMFSYIGNWDVLIPISKTGKYGYCDQKVNRVIDYQYDHAYAFENGLALVELSGMYGAINTKGEIIVSIEFTKLNRRDDLIIGKTAEGKMIIFDQKGKRLTQNAVENVQKVNKQLYLLEDTVSSRLLKINN